MVYGDTTMWRGDEDITTSPFGILPMEVNQMILFDVGDVDSLLSAAIACPELHNAFLGVEQLLMSKIVNEQIDPTVLPDAIAALDSKYMRDQPLDEVEGFLRTHYSCREPTMPGRWLLQSGRDIVHFHRLIQKFTHEFIQTSSNNFPDPDHAPGARAVTWSETLRIQRAFYRYEVLCNISRLRGTLDVFLDHSQPTVSSEMRQDIFLTQFSPWENEQLGCIYDYLVDTLHPNFVQFARHDIEWAQCPVQWTDQDFSTAYFHGVLSSGLAEIRRILRCARFGCQEDVWPKRPQHRASFLWLAFRRVNGALDEEGLRPRTLHFTQGGRDSTRLQDFNSDQERRFVNRPFFDDPDRGPEMMWRSMHRHSNARQLMLIPHLIVNRKLPSLKWGYVFWDEDRIFSMNRWASRVTAPPNLGTVQEMTRRQNERYAMWDNIKTRQWIHQQGGRGWWSEADVGRVRWTMQRLRRDGIRVPHVKHRVRGQMKYDLRR